MMQHVSKLSQSELEIALYAPVCPELLPDDAVVVAEDGWYRTATPSSDFRPDNEILVSNLTGKNADSEIDRMFTEYHERIERAFSWCVYPWTQPEDLGERLINLGGSDYEVSVFLENTSLPLKVVPGVSVKQVSETSAIDLERYLRIMASRRAMSIDEITFRRQRYQRLIGGDSPVLQLFVAYCDNTPAGCCATILKRDYGYMTGAYIYPDFRAKGLFQSLLAAQHNALRDCGIKLSCGHAYTHGSGRWLERFGFRKVYNYKVYVLKPEWLIT